VAEEKKKITKWAPMAGLWDISTENPVYLKPQTKNRLHGRPVAICASEILFQGGRAEVTVCFAKHATGGVDPDTSGAILIGFRSVDAEYFAIGLGGYGAEYTLLRFAPEIHTWVGLTLAGTLENLRPEHPYHLSVWMQGQRLSLKVDGVPVLAHRLETAPPQGQLGLYAWGDSRIEFREASVTEEAGKVFVVMPFKDYYLNELFPSVIEPTVGEESNNLVAHHAGGASGPGVIIKDIERDISESKIVIADITECNSNAYYEVGYAHASKIPTILLVQEDTNLPFDIGGYRCIFYKNTIAGKERVIKRLRDYIKEILGR
jgi:hypothetical protein